MVHSHCLLEGIFRKEGDMTFITHTDPLLDNYEEFEEGVNSRK